MFKKKNIFEKYFIKYFDRKAYKLYKLELVYQKNLQFGDFLAVNNRLTNINKIKSTAIANKQLNFCHSGNAGDIMYALPTIKKIQQITGVPVNIFLRSGRPLQVGYKMSHPLGNVMLNDKMISMLLPLVSSQSYINFCGPYTDQPIDIDLDFFRAGLVPLDRGNIAHWCGYLTGVNPDLAQKWINVEPNNAYNDYIIIARSERYRNPLIDYSFLKKYPKVKFIGVESELKDISKAVPNIGWLQVENFLELAQIIAGCKFFIGNQSFPFAIAESLKVPRIMEVSLDIINVIPEGGRGYDFLFQDHLEALVEELYKS